MNNFKINLQLMRRKRNSDIYFGLISLLGHLVLFHLILKILYFSFSVHNASINLAKDSCLNWKLTHEKLS